MALGLFIAVGAVNCVPAGDSAVPKPADVVVDGAQRFQRFDGVGVNANPARWTGAERRAVLDALIDRGGARIWRVIVENADWEATNDNADPWSFNGDFYASLYESPKFRNVWDTIGELNAKGVTVVLNAMGVVPAWMGGRAIRPDAEDEWVEMIVSLVHHARRIRNLDVRLLAPVNEPDLGPPEGPSIAPVQLARLLGKLASRLDTVGLTDVRLIAPDVAYIDRAPDYVLAVLNASPVVSRIDHVAVHNYDGQLGPLVSIAERLGRHRLWVTEWGARCPRCDYGEPVADEWLFAFASGRHLLSHLRDGASAALFYDAYDSVYEHHDAHVSASGLLAWDPSLGSVHPRKRFHAVAQIARFVPSGSVRIRTTGAPADLPIEAFVHGATGRLSIVGANITPSARTIRVRLKNVPAVERVASSVTTATLDVHPKSDVTVSNQSFAVVVPAGSLFALTGMAGRRRL